MLRAGISVALVVAVSAITSAVGAASRRDTLVWQDCGSGFECSVLSVPVDYSKPNEQQVDLAVTRIRASQPDQRVGTLFVNYGGPGDPATETLRGSLPGLPPVIRQRFDVVTFDPRGTGESRGIDCLDDRTFDRWLADDVTPDDEQELHDVYDGRAQAIDLIGACVDKFGSWLAHVGTRNAARDIDRLRAALGESQLSFLGYSYGTVLGAVYAQEFPNRIRGMVLDSVVDLSASPDTELRRATKGFETTLNKFLDDCAHKPSCAFYSGGDPRGAFERLRDRFEAGLQVPSIDRRETGVSEFYGGVIGGVYSPAYWPPLAQALQSATEGDGTGLRVLNGLINGARRDGSYDNIQEAIPFILCADRRVKRVSFARFRNRFHELSEEYPLLGPALAGASGCDRRIPKSKARDRVGDVRAHPDVPVVVVGITGDPATPYEGAIDLQQRLTGSRLITVAGSQHGGFGRGFPCLDDVVDAYLVDGQTPPENARCT